MGGGQLHPALSRVLFRFHPKCISISAEAAKELNGYTCSACKKGEVKPEVDEGQEGDGEIEEDKEHTQPPSGDGTAASEGPKVGSLKPPFQVGGLPSLGNNTAAEPLPCQPGAEAGLEPLQWLSLGWLRSSFLQVDRKAKRVKR